jgi:tetratricopeptide (TPR) repeat protein
VRINNLLAVSIAITATAAMQSPSVARVSADAAPPGGGVALRARGLELGYNLDHAEAIATFKQAIDSDPQSPTGYRLLAAAAWVTLLFEQGAITVDDFLGQARAEMPRSAPAESLSQLFHDSLEKAIAISERRLHEQPSDPAAHYEVGAAYGLLASYIATVDGRLTRSLGAGRRAYREHQRTLNLDPRRKDAGLIVGTYRYAVSELSAPLRLGAYLAGLGGGRERGLEMVEEAARYPSDVQSNARFTSILLYNRAGRFDEALRVIGELQRKYPRNRLLWLEAAGTALRAGRPGEARTMVEAGLAQLAGDERRRAPGEDARWHYTHGAALVALNDAVGAGHALRAALDGEARDWLRGHTHKELGKLASLAADRKLALEEYRLADRLCRQDHDEICAAEVKALIRKGER